MNWTGIVTFAASTYVALGGPMPGAPWEQFEAWIDERVDDIRIAAAEEMGNAPSQSQASERIASHLQPAAVVQVGQRAAMVDGATVAAGLTAVGIVGGFDGNGAWVVGIAVVTVACFLASRVHLNAGIRLIRRFRKLKWLWSMRWPQLYVVGCNVVAVSLSVRG